MGLAALENLAPEGRNILAWFSMCRRSAANFSNWAFYPRLTPWATDLPTLRVCVGWNLVGKSGAVL